MTAEEAVLETLETAVDEIEDQLEEILPVVAKRVVDPRVYILAAAVGGAIAGSLVTYKATQHALSTKYEGLANEEVREAREHYQKLAKVDENDVPLTPAQVLEQEHGAEAVEALRSYQKDEHLERPVARVVPTAKPALSEVKVSVSVDEGEEIPSPRNIFDPTDAINEDELQARDPEFPYVITHDEYFENDSEYSQISMTYYEGDDTLVDDADQPVNDVDKIVGSDCLTRFGEGSKDANIVYVRNEKMELQIEVARSKGTYVKEVLGFEEEDERQLKHSSQRRMRAGDD